MSNFTPVFLTISIDGVKGFAIYPYADLVQSSLYKLKGCFDIEMAKVFIDRYKTYLNLKYDGYIKRQLKQVEGFAKLEKKKIPKNIDYSKIKGLRIEAAQKLQKYRPVSIGQASRISGVSPADINVLMVYI